MKNNNDNELLDKYKMYVAISKFQDNNTNKRTNEYPQKNILKKWREFAMKKRIAIVSTLSIFIISGVAFATNIENIKNFFGGGLDEATQTAAENGYISNPEMDYMKSDTTVENLGTILDNIPTEVKIEDFMMDDLNLNVEFDFKFDEQIKNIFDLDNLHNMCINDLIIRDEENNILYAGNDKQAFEKYCNENNLDYVFGENNEKYFNCGLQWYPFSHDKNDSSVKLTYNMYASDTYPKSKKLYFSFGKITLRDESNENIITLKGNWNIELDVPENMYNRTTESYKVVKCDNENFDIYASKVSDTGFEIGVTINNIERPEYPEELHRVQKEIWSKYEGIVDQAEPNKEYQEFLKNNPSLLEKYKQFLDKSEPITINDYKTSSLIGETDVSKHEKCEKSYVENSIGEKFYSTLSPSRKANNNFIDENIFDFYETFSMTKYNATDKIKVVLYYYGEPVTIELEKTK